MRPINTFTSSSHGVWLTDELWKTYIDIAERKNISVSSLISKLLRHYIREMSPEEFNKIISNI